MKSRLLKIWQSVCVHNLVKQKCHEHQNWSLNTSRNISVRKSLNTAVVYNETFTFNFKLKLNNYLMEIKSQSFIVCDIILQVNVLIYFDKNKKNIMANLDFYSINTHFECVCRTCTLHISTHSICNICSSTIALTSTYIKININYIIFN